MQKISKHFNGFPPGARAFRFVRSGKHSVGRRVHLGMTGIFLSLCLPFLLVGSCDLSQSRSRAYAATGEQTLVLNEENNRSSAANQKRYRKVMINRARQDVSTLAGMSPDDVLMILNEPGLRRTEGAVQVWQYRAKACVLDVYIGQDDAPGVESVVHYELRSRIRAAWDRPYDAPEPTLDEARCFASVYAAAQGRGTLFASLF